MPMKKTKRFAAVLAALMLSTPLVQLPAADTAEAATRLQAPSNVMLYPDLQVTWDAVANSSSYEIFVFNNQNVVIHNEYVYGSNKTSHKLTTSTLSSGSYYVKVVARGNGYNYTDSPLSSQSNVLTISATMTLQAPSAPQLTTAGLATWPATLNNGYQLNLYHSPSNTLVTSQMIGKDATSFDISTLIPGTGSYYIKLVAMGDGQSMTSSPESNASGVQSFIVEKLPAPSTVELGYNRVVSWPNVQNNNGYRISVYNASTNSVIGFAQAPKDATSLDVKHLINQGGTYYVRVQTIGAQNNSSADSAASEQLRISGEAGVYLVPERLLTQSNGNIEDKPYTFVDLQNSSVLTDLSGDNGLSTLQVEVPVASGRLALRMSGQVIEQLLSRSANGEVRLFSGIGQWKLPVKQIRDLAESNRVNLSSTTVQLELAQEPSTVNNYEITPVRTDLQLIGHEGSVLATMDDTAGYQSLSVLYSYDNSDDERLLAGLRVLDPAQGVVTPVPAYFFQEGESPKMVTFRYQGTGTFSVMKFNVDFTDVPHSYYAKDSIESLSAKLVISGFGDGTFRPHDSVTRAQFAKLLVQALGLEMKYTQAELLDPFDDTKVQPAFDDVAKNAWYFNAVETAYAAGLINGRGAGRFAPEDQITDQEMATMVTRALQYAGHELTLTAEQKYSLLNSLSKQSDIADYAKDPVALCMYAEILYGPTVNGFDPHKTADRGMAADMLYRMMKTLEFAN